MKELFIVRGCSGSGKTTIAKFLRNANASSLMISPDDWDGYYVDGQYHFTVENYVRAHHWMRTVVGAWISQGYGPIIVHEVFALRSEFQPLIDMGKEAGYRVHTMIVENRHEGENVHNVANAVLEAQHHAMNIQLLPPRIQYRSNMEGNFLCPATGKVDQTRYNQ